MDNGENNDEDFLLTKIPQNHHFDEIKKLTHYNFQKIQHFINWIFLIFYKN